MNYADAITQLLQHRRLRLSRWPAGDYIELFSEAHSGLGIHSHTTVVRNSRGMFIAYIAAQRDYVATDWELLP